MISKAKKIKLVVLDVDGTLTEGTIFLDNEGIETKAFNVRDGFAIVNAIKEGIEFGIITGRKSALVEKRAEELGIKYVFQGIGNKAIKLQELLEDLKLTMEEVAYMGDDINDLSVIKLVGLSGAPKDACSEVLSKAQMITEASGGKGAVREFLEFILKSQNKWENIIKRYEGI